MAVDPQKFYATSYGTPKTGETLPKTNLQPKQFHQLQLYMTPDELGNLGSGDYGTKVSEVPEIKRSENDHVTDTLDRYHRAADELGGIHNPVSVVHRPEGPELVDGHHRATVALESDRLVPVVHYEPHEKGKLWGNAMVSKDEWDKELRK